MRAAIARGGKANKKKDERVNTDINEKGEGGRDIRTISSKFLNSKEKAIFER